MADPDGTELPYLAEYARLRGTCKLCTEPIPRDELALSARELNIRSGGMINHDYHLICFFEGRTEDHLPKKVNDIANFECLRWDDQQKIRAELAERAAGAHENASRGSVKRRRLGSCSEDEYSIGYSSGFGGACEFCKLIIAQDELEVFKADKPHGMASAWYHLECFVNVRELIEFSRSGYDLNGFDKLKEDDQVKVMALLPLKTLLNVTNWSNIKPSEVAKKAEEIFNMVEEKKQLQNKRMYEYRDQLKALKVGELVLLLAVNGQEEPSTLVDMLDMLSDQLAFGALPRCLRCKVGQLTFRSWTGYCCGAWLNVWTICGEIYDTPPRVPFNVPEELKQKYPFLNACGPPETRLFEKRARNAWLALVKKIWPIGETSKRLQPTQAAIEVENDLVVHPLSKNGALYSHVYRSEADGTAYSTSLTYTDLVAGINSFFTIQVLESHSNLYGEERRYWLFKSSGIIGGDCWCTERTMPLAEAVKVFEAEFKKHTGNAWADRNDFRKVAGKKCFVPEYKNKPSSLEKPVRELIEVFMDDQAMSEIAIIEPDDLERMPLGRLSQMRILEAEAVLQRLNKMLTNAQNPPDWGIIIAYTNMFYTFIPHSFSMSNPPAILNNVKTIKKKFEMLKTLLEITFLYYPQPLLHLPRPTDFFYQQLNVSLRPVSRREPIYRFVQCCTKISSKTKSDVRHEVLEVFEVERHGERERFNPRGLQHRKLLWHGSRVTNFARILAWGLMAAPKNVHITGSQFGRGIYFADLIAKAGWFCRVSKANTNARRISTVGLIVLCEVALGNVKHLFDLDRTLQRPPRGYDSVKGLGKHASVPWRLHQGIFNDDELEMDYPEGLIRFENDILRSAAVLDANEYIVYDPTQVLIRYLVQFRVADVNLLPIN